MNEKKKEGICRKFINNHLDFNTLPTKGAKEFFNSILIWLEYSFAFRC